MSNKMTCPGCDSHSSSILTALLDDRPCPYCGLSAEAMREIEEIRQSRADEALQARLQDAIKERDEAQREAAWSKSRLGQVERDLEALLALARKPLQSEESW
ncbi:hypothetical protein [Acrocarpospora sp. B8E8]|uniref:hypothetical protein n=1 Tax=Acrocarpospora sp. B8E8 TaxID=3153572 RepID=UPI00325D6FD4